MTEYLTSRGRLYSFSGWPPYEEPLQCFDDSDWLRCLHGCMLALALLADAERTQLAIEDDGLAHELLHLATGVGLCTHNTYAGLRAEVERLQADLDESLK